jgi:hypothetical protein
MRWWLREWLRWCSNTKSALNLAQCVALVVERARH